MKILVLNGSPKGKQSITMQYVHYLEYQFPEHSFNIQHISHRVQELSQNQTEWDALMSQVQEADGILWAFPVYFLLVPSQYKRWIELVQSRNATNLFAGKYTASFSTSAHFYDHTAHAYIQGICEDWEMQYINFFSADMMDLLHSQTRRQWLSFAKEFFYCITQSMPTLKKYPSLQIAPWVYSTGPVQPKVDLGKKKLRIVVDDPSQGNLKAMIQRLSQNFSGDVQIIEFSQIQIQGGCIGCIHCAEDNRCWYPDPFVPFYLQELMEADILLYAGSIKDRYLSWQWKQFFDRRFFRNHTPTLYGKQLGFIISGPYLQLPILQDILAAYTELEGANLIGVLSDDAMSSADALNIALDTFAQTAVRYSEQNYHKPSTFRSIAGMKLLRDEIWTRLKFVFQADHRFYKKNKIYDFPQSSWKVVLTNFIFDILHKIPGFNKDFYSPKMKARMIQPLQKFLASKGKIKEI